MGCEGGAGGEWSLQPAREYEPVGRRIRWDATPAQRYGLSAQDFGGGTIGEDDAAVAALHYVTPPGWIERPPSMFRDANFVIADDERAECYLTTLMGDGGGLEANVNRWRAQLSMPPLDAEAIAALPRRAWLGGQAVAVDVSGRWTGMSGDESEEGWRLVGRVLVQPNQSHFLKLVGPEALIERELPAFEQLADSFHIGTGHAHDAEHAAEAAPDVQQNASLSWRAPSGWTRGPERELRELTYFAGAAGEVECYVTLLGGSGGGALANINRWCGQMGAPPLTEVDLAALERVPMAGAEGLLVDLARGPGATAAEGQERLLGVVCILAERALFVKLGGPREAVAGQRAALVDFCGSLRVLR